MMSKDSYVYMVRCSDGSYYSGWSTDPVKRVRTHNSGRGARYTRSRLPVELVYTERCHNKSDALKREASLKKMTHAQKKQLADSWFPFGIYIKAGAGSSSVYFRFHTEREDGAWYELDHAVSNAGNETFYLNADREVYAVYTLSSGEKRYGTVGDDENETLADNDGFRSGETYLFYEDPSTEEYYK